MHNGRQRGLWPGLALAALLCVSVTPGVARAQMPDLRQMSGQPLPSGDLPAGSISVRVVRGAITNNLADQEVTLEGGGPARKVKTDASGRALFSGLAPGTIWRATVTVDGERLESQAIELPAAGGLRVLLAAGLQGGAAAAPPSSAPAPAPGMPGASPSAPGVPAAPFAGAPTPSAPPLPSTPAVPGEVAFGSQSRFVIELAEGSLEVYGLFDIVNLGSAPVMPAAPIVFEAPADASNTNVLEGSSPQAKADGRKVTITGPFVPGNTSVQIAYRLRYDGSTVQISQAVPLGLPQTTIIVRKFGKLEATLTGMVGQREVPLEGRSYLVLNGRAVKPGERVELTLAGLPHRAAWPRNTALTLAAIVLIGGLYLAFSTPRTSSATDDAVELRARREQRFDELMSIERALRERPNEPTAAREGRLARRAALIAEVEALDDALVSVLPEEAQASAGRAAAAEAERFDARPAVR